MLAGGFVWETGVVPVGLEASQISHRRMNQNQNQVYMVGSVYKTRTRFKKSPPPKKNPTHKLFLRIQIDCLTKTILTVRKIEIQFKFQELVPR